MLAKVYKWLTYWKCPFQYKLTPHECYNTIHVLWPLFSQKDNNPSILHYRQGMHIEIYHYHSGYVRKYYDVKNRAFLQNIMRDFEHLYAQVSLVNQKEYDRCENRSFSMTNMRGFLNLMCEIAHRAALTISLLPPTRSHVQEESRRMGTDKTMAGHVGPGRTRLNSSGRFNQEDKHD